MELSNFKFFKDFHVQKESNARFSLCAFDFCVLNVHLRGRMSINKIKIMCINYSRLSDIAELYVLNIIKR